MEISLITIPYSLLVSFFFLRKKKDSQLETKIKPQSRSAVILFCIFILIALFFAIDSRPTAFFLFGLELRADLFLFFLFVLVLNLLLLQLKTKLKPSKFYLFPFIPIALVIVFLIGCLNYSNISSDGEIIPNPIDFNKLGVLFLSLFYPLFLFFLGLINLKEEFKALFLMIIATLALLFGLAIYGDSDLFVLLSRYPLFVFFVFLLISLGIYCFYQANRQKESFRIK